MYEYKVVEVPIQSSLKSKNGDSFKQCIEVINQHAKEGWRLVQVVVPPHEKTGIMMAFAYEIIFEKPVSK